MSDDKLKGLYGKFHVERTDGKSAPGEKHENCEYFVLDITHDIYAVTAYQAYADACRKVYPLLAADIDSWFERKGAVVAEMFPNDGR